MCSQKPAVVAEWFRACDQNQVDCHSKTRFESRLRQKSIWLQFALAIILCQRNTVLIAQSQKWLVAIQIAGHRVALPLTISTRVRPLLNDCKGCRLHICYRLLRLTHIKAHVKTVVCGLCMAVVVVDSLICMAGYVCAQCLPWGGLEHMYMHGSVVDMWNTPLQLRWTEDAS